MYLTRQFENKVREFSKYFKVVLILGSRQVGKSTLLTHIFPHLKHIVFDPVSDRFSVRTDPDLFLQNFPSPIILDEVQYVPELLSAIKRRVDENEAKGQYFLTGSHNLMMLRQIAESMAGRVGIIELSPLSIYELTGNGGMDGSWLNEYLDNPDKFSNCNYVQLDAHNSLYETIWRGGMPGILDFPSGLVSDYFKSYLQTYLERDVRLVENVDDLTLFSRFIGILSMLTAQEINYTHLGREIGVQAKTISRWLGIMQTCYQWHEILPYYGNTIKRLSKKRKGYFFDTGIACYLQHISSVEALASHPNLGALFETWVINQLKILNNVLSSHSQIYHWRTSAGAEIDILLERDNIFYPIEIKCKTNLSKHDARGMLAFRDSYPNLNIAKGLIIYAGEISYPINNYVTAISWKTLRCAVSS